MASSKRCFSRVGGGWSGALSFESFPEAPSQPAEPGFPASGRREDHRGDSSLTFTTSRPLAVSQRRTKAQTPSRYLATAVPTDARRSAAAVGRVGLANHRLVHGWEAGRRIWLIAYTRAFLCTKQGRRASKWHNSATSVRNLPSLPSR